MSEQSLGERLKSLREKQGLSREQLYSRTKILVNYIEALEEGRWDLLPGQAYLKPFLKNIAEALNADYQELAEMVDQKTLQKKSVQAESESKGFDYRWLAVILMVILVALIIFILNPLKYGRQEPVIEPPAEAGEMAPDHSMLERPYSGGLDLEGDIFEEMQIFSVRLTAIDSVWVVLTAEDDTLYAGTLPKGRSIVRESIRPIELFMARLNCLAVTYNGVALDRESILKNRHRIKVADIDLRALEASGR